MEICSQRQRNAWDHQKLEETGRIIPQKLEREHGPTDSLITYFCIYNFARINFSWLMPSNVSQFFAALAQNSRLSF